MATSPPRDWTWVLDRACDECGVEVSTVPVSELGARLRENAVAWQTVLAAGEGLPGTGASGSGSGGADLARRPWEHVWSPLEYACHVRDVHGVFAARVRLMQAQHEPPLPEWDQDRAVVAGEYAAQAPARVSQELAMAAGAVAELYDEVTGAQWERTGRRGDGFTFSIASLGRYHLHDVVHHLHDVGGGAR